MSVNLGKYMMRTNEQCQICDSIDNVTEQSLVPDQLTIDFDNDILIFLCESCSLIKQNIDEHISKTSGEYHTVNNEYTFIDFCEYWSDWSSSSLHDKYANSSRLSMNANKIWNTYSYANRKYNFSTKQKALRVMIESRIQYQHYLGVISFSSYQLIFQNITNNLLNPNESKLSRTMSHINITLHNNKITISKWLECRSVNYFLNNSIKLF